MATKREITPEILRQLLDYDSVCGSFKWRVRDVSLFDGGYHPPEHDAAIWNNRYAGKHALIAKHSMGYLSGSIYKTRILAHRAAWAHFHGMMPEDLVDHINGDKTDNSIANLRVVSYSENMRNAKHSKKSQSGYLGVKLKYGSRWHATGYLHKKHIFLGSFDTKQEAIAARRHFEKENGFTDRHGYR